MTAQAAINSITQPAIERAIEELAAIVPVSAARARIALAKLLQGVDRSSWPEVAWNFSRLTWDGFPIEFTCTSADSAIRYTVEVAGPEAPDTTRLNRAAELISNLGVAPEPATLEVLSRIQASGGLRYGAWIGGRHDAAGDRYKIYAEVPESGAPAAHTLVEELLGEQPLLPARRPLLRMIGYEPGSARTELYFRADGLQDWEVSLLLRRAGLLDRREELFGLFEEAYGRRIAGGLPSRMGFSFSLARDGEPTVFSLFCFARALFGSDAGIRRAILTLADRRGWDFSAYAGLSTPMAQRTGGKNWHGMVAFIALPVGQPAIHIGVRPPNAKIDDGRQTTDD